MKMGIYYPEGNAVTFSWRKYVIWAKAGQIQVNSHLTGLFNKNTGHLAVLPARRSKMVTLPEVLISQRGVRIICDLKCEQ